MNTEFNKFIVLKYKIIIRLILIFNLYLYVYFRIHYLILWKVLDFFKFSIFVENYKDYLMKLILSWDSYISVHSCFPIILAYEKSKFKLDAS